MQSTNFKPGMLEKINAQLAFVLENRYSDFYRKKYSGTVGKISSHEDFKKIPFLTKIEFSELSLEEITFVPPEEILFYSFSGGTSTGRPTVLPVSDYGFEEITKNYFNEAFFEQVGVKTVMTLLQPSSAPLLRCLRLPDRRTTIIPGDIHNLALMAKIAKQMGIQGIIATTSRLSEFAKQLEKINYDLSRIKWISAGSEFCPAGVIAKFKAKMPNAYINIRCGNSDIGGSRGYRCRYLAEKTGSPELFHPTNPLIEITNDAGTVVPFGELGEIVHTDLKKKAFPIIRYKTGDMATLSQTNCPCGNDLLLTFEGKRGFDFIEISDYILRSRAIADALAGVENFVDGRFQLHVFSPDEKKLNETSLVLHLKLAEKYHSKCQDEIFKKMLSSAISEKIFVSPDMTLAKLVEKSLIKPLELRLMQSWQYSPQKAKHIVLHKEEA